MHNQPLPFQIPPVRHIHLQVLEGSSVNPDDLLRLPLAEVDTVILLDTNMDGSVLDENDARLVAAMRLILRIRARMGVDRPLHFVASVQRPSSLEVVRGAGRLHGASVTAILNMNLEAGAIVHVLWEPDLALVFQDLLDTSSGAEMGIVPALALLGDAYRGALLNFAMLQTLCSRKRAVALGVYSAEGSLHLAPWKGELIRVGAGDKIVVLVESGARVLSLLDT